MGIRFNCHACDHEVHINSGLAGRRGKCPSCKTSFRIPADGSSVSLPVNTHRVAQTVNMEKQSSAEADSETTVKKPIEESILSHDSAKPTSSSVSPKNEITQVSQFYVRPPSGDTFGPADKQILVQWAGENRITADTLVRRPVDDQWSRLDQQFPELFDLDAAAANLGTQAGPNTTDTINESCEPANTATQSVISTDSGATPNTKVLSGKRRKQKSRALMWLIVLGVIAVGLFAILVIIILSGFTLRGASSDEARYSNTRTGTAFVFAFLQQLLRCS